jgi:hypothetical protein
MHEHSTTRSASRASSAGASALAQKASSGSSSAVTAVCRGIHTSARPARTAAGFRRIDIERLARSTLRQFAAAGWQ